MSEDRISVVIAAGVASFNLKTLSTTEISVDVVSRPQKADQSLTTIPAPTTSDPLFTVPACQTHTHSHHKPCQQKVESNRETYKIID